MSPFSFLMTYKDKCAHGGKEYKLCPQHTPAEKGITLLLAGTDNLLGGSVLGSLLNIS